MQRSVALSLSTSSCHQTPGLFQDGITWSHGLRRYFLVGILVVERRNAEGAELHPSCLKARSYKN